MNPSRPFLHLALTFVLILGTMTGACRGGGDEAAGAEGDASGDGMEPRIVTEHPQDSPGRPADGDRAATAIDAEPGAAWVPHLTAADLEASVDFYRGLGFEVGSRQEGERVELARDGVRLVLVAAPGGGGPDGAEDNGGDGTEVAAGDDAAAPGEAAAAPGPAPLVLHLVDDTGGAGGRTVRDPDGHRVAIPGGG
jgi:catechol 2,3-dioxygenase-like lactoylglutathione lyase family enzyme